MNTIEPSLEKLFYFFEHSTCAFISPMIGKRTLEALSTNPSFLHFLQKSSGGQEGDRAVPLFNKAQLNRMRQVGTQLSAKGELQVGSAQIRLENVGIFLNINLKEATAMARSFFQRAFIFVMRGNFFLYTSKDFKSFSIEDMVVMKPGDYSIKGKEFSMTFDTSVPQDEISAMAEAIFEAALLPSGIANRDEVDQELQVWLAMATAKIKIGEYKEARQAVHAMAGILDTLV